MTLNNSSYDLNLSTSQIFKQWAHCFQNFELSNNLKSNQRPKYLHLNSFSLKRLRVLCWQQHLYNFQQSSMDMRQELQERFSNDRKIRFQYRSEVHIKLLSLILKLLLKHRLEFKLLLRELMLNCLQNFLSSRTNLHLFKWNLCKFSLLSFKSFPHPRFQKLTLIKMGKGKLQQIFQSWYMNMFKFYRIRSFLHQVAVTSQKAF